MPQRWKLTNQLGSGTYGTVYEAVDSVTKQTVAVKKCKNYDGLSFSILREIVLLKRLNHKNIVKFIDCEFCDIESLDPTVYIVLELLDCDLTSLIEQRRIDTIKSFTTDIVNGLSYLHENGIMHRDLKPQNILYDIKTKTLKIADFSNSKQFISPNRAMTPRVASLYYRAPEILLMMEEHSFPIDIWSLGCVFAELILGRPLCAGDCEIGQLYKIFEILGTPIPGEEFFITKAKFWSNSFPKYSKKTGNEIFGDKYPELQDLIFKLLKYDPKERLTCKDIMEHSWFQSV